MDGLRPGGGHLRSYMAPIQPLLVRAATDATGVQSQKSGGLTIGGVEGVYADVPKRWRRLPFVRSRYNAQGMDRRIYATVPLSCVVPGHLRGSANE